MSDIDTVMQDGKWTFDAEVTRVFPDMLSRSIPGMDLMRELTMSLALGPLTSREPVYVLDLGCSRGEMLDLSVKSTFFGDMHCVGVDSSVDMITYCRSTFHDENMTFVHADIRDVEIMPNRYNVVYCILTAQFVPLEHRQALIRNIYQGMASGGRLFWVEKVLGSNATGQEALTAAYDLFKKRNGYSDAQIAAKKKSLEGVLVPLQGAQNASWLVSEGFTTVQQYWQALNFGAWMAIK